MKDLQSANTSFMYTATTLTVPGEALLLPSLFLGKGVLNSAEQSVSGDQCWRLHWGKKSCLL